MFLAPDWSREFSDPIDREVTEVDLTFLAANDDDFVDVCVGTEDGFVLIFYGNGTGQFPVLSEAYAGPDFEAVRAADLDGDGIDEILASVGIPGLVILTSSASAAPSTVADPSAALPPVANPRILRFEDVPILRLQDGAEDR